MNIFDIDTEYDYDKVSVQDIDGNTEDECSGTSPDDSCQISVSGSNYITIQFTSDSAIESSGFDLSFHL